MNDFTDDEIEDWLDRLEHELGGAREWDFPQEGGR